MSETIASDARDAESRAISFPAMFWDSFKPFPGRGRITLRLAISCTLIVLVSYTFRMPFQDLMPFFVLFITKEEKVTTTVTAILVLFTVTIAIAAALLIYKFTGDRPEFRVPIIALEIFVGMYLFRVFSIGPVGWIIGFVCAAAQSVVYLFPSPEEAVHQFLWLWVAIAFSIAIAWLANLLLFPVSPKQLLQREFAAGWSAVSAATERLAGGQPGAGLRLLRPLAKSGPTRLLKLLKLSSIDSPDLRREQTNLQRLILSLDKVAKLILAYAKAQLSSTDHVTVSSAEAAVLGAVREKAESFKREFEAGLVPSSKVIQPQGEAVEDMSRLLLETENTLRDLEAESAAPEKAAPSHKRSLLVPDALSNPRHAQFAIKVTLAGMIGYLFYTASDYYGIHTVFYTPLIIALSSAGATIHKGLLRIVGCAIGGTLGLIFSIWLLPRFEGLGAFLFMIFCVHGLAAWIAVGSEQISYIGLQIALAFDLGFLQGYGPPENIDPLRDRFIGIVLGIGIITVVFSLIWPESAELSARERLASCLRSIARLLRSVGTGSGSSTISPASASTQNPEERELFPTGQLELEITSRLSEAHSYEEQVAFEALLHGYEPARASHLEEVSQGVEAIYVACLPWLREQASKADAIETTEPITAREKMMHDVDAAVQSSASSLEACADRLQPTVSASHHAPETEMIAQEPAASKALGELVRVVRRFQDRLLKAEPPAPGIRRESIPFLGDKF
jgi:multidrug resistance protein MdtO